MQGGNCKHGACVPLATASLNNKAWVDAHLLVSWKDAAALLQSHCCFSCIWCSCARLLAAQATYAKASSVGVSQAYVCGGEVGHSSQQRTLRQQSPIPSNV
jgi:hypothetical protein